MMDERQQKMWGVLTGLDGETAARLLLDCHGLQLLDDGFFEHLVDEGYIEEPDVEEEEDNYENGTYNCDSCSLNGDCPQQGADGNPRWVEAVGFDEFCSRFPLCEGCPIRDIPGECEDENWPKWKEEHANA